MSKAEEVAMQHCCAKCVHDKLGCSILSFLDTLEVKVVDLDKDLTENFGSRNKNAPNGKSQFYRRA